MKDLRREGINKSINQSNDKSINQKSNNQPSADGCFWREKKMFQFLMPSPRSKGREVISGMPVNRGNNKRFVTLNDTWFGLSDHIVVSNSGTVPFTKALLHDNISHYCVANYVLRIQNVIAGLLRLSIP